MRKTLQCREWNILLTRRRTVRNRRRKRIKINLRSIRATSIRVTLPKMLNLMDEANGFRGKLLTQIEKIHTFIKKGKKDFLINFSHVEKAYSCGMLLLYSEIRNIRNRYGYTVRFRYIRPSKPKVQQVLEQIGLLKIFNEIRRPTPEDHDVVNWKFTSGNNVSGDKYDDVIPVAGDGLERLSDINMYGGFIEAIKNSVNHAYREQRPLSQVSSDKESWWMFSQIRDDLMTIAICDLGVGIPCTLPHTRPSFWERLKTIGASTDADVIKNSIEHGRSRTEEEHRGNGLPTMAGIAKKVEGASLAIHSNYGMVSVRDKTMRTHNYRSTISGTLIQWTVPLS